MNSFMKGLFSDNPISHTISLMPALIIVVVIIAVLVGVGILIVKFIYIPLKERKTIESISSSLDEMSKNIQAISAILPYIYGCIKHETLSVDTLNWLIDTIAENFPNILLGNLISLKSKKGIELETIELAIKTSITYTLERLLRAPDSEFLLQKDKNDVIDDIASESDEMTNTMIEDCSDYLIKYESTPIDEIFMYIYIVARTHVCDIRNIITEIFGVKELDKLRIGHTRT